MATRSKGETLQGSLLLRAALRLGLQLLSAAEP
jgi:hypothetical protein